jgi:hypothetical protein
MTQDKYFMMMEQLGKEPIDSEVPPAWEDFPDIVLNAISTFNSLGDRMYPDIGYVGKDYTNLVYYLELHVIEDKEFFLDILSWLDARAIKKSSEQLKKQHDKLKRKK